MKSLINESNSFLRNHSEYIGPIIAWIDNGTTINRVMNNTYTIKRGKYCEEDIETYDYYKEIIVHLYNLVSIPVTEDIIFYRAITGVINTMQPDDILPAERFTSLTHREEEVNHDFGQNVMRITVEKGNLAYYISSYDIVVTKEPERSEYETLVLPGSFTYLGQYNGYYDFVYTNPHTIDIGMMKPIIK